MRLAYFKCDFYCSWKFHSHKNTTIHRLLSDVFGNRVLNISNCFEYTVRCNGSDSSERINYCP